MSSTGFNLLNVLIVLVPMLLAVAFMTIIERKVLAAMQRRVGPDTVGIYGIAQPFADAAKLVLKETIIPAQANKVLFYLAPVATLIFSLLGWAVIPFGDGLVLFDFSLGVLYTLALSSLGIYGVLFAGWSANSKYAFLGSLRSTAAMISYELILSTAIIIIILLTGSFNITKIIECQQSVWHIVPLLPVFFFFFISILAETSRTPFDLQEAVLNKIIIPPVLVPSSPYGGDGTSKSEPFSISNRRLTYDPSTTWKIRFEFPARERSLPAGGQLTRAD